MHNYAIKIANVVLFLVWGFAETYWNSRMVKQNPDGQVTSKESKVYLQAAFSLALFIAMPLAFLDIGKIDCCFPYFALAGYIIAVIGLVVRIAAIAALDKQFSTDVRIIKGHELVTTGIFRYIRHPSYTGYLMIPLGIAIAFSNWITIILLFVPNIFSVAYRIKVEEKALEENFGGEYAEYRKRTKMLIPGVF